MKFFNERNLTISLAVGIILGIVFGILAQGPYEARIDGEVASRPWLVAFIESMGIFGSLFIGALKMVVVPIVLFSVTSGIANLQGGNEVGRKMTKTVAYFLATSFIAVLIGILFTNVIGPGKGGDPDELKSRLPQSAMVSAEGKQASVADAAPKTLLEFVDKQIDNLFMNPFQALAEMNLTGVVFFSILLGLMLMLCGERASPAIAFFSAMNEALMKMVQIVIWLAPVGVFALAANLLMNLGPEVIGMLGKYFLTVVLALATHLLIVHPLILKFVCGYSPLKFFAGVKEALLLAVSTASSSATLPVTLRVVEENLGVDKRSADFVLPMGATINMDGTALYEAVAAMFVAQLLGVELGIGQQFLVFFTATLDSGFAAGDESLDVALFGEDEIPWDEIAFRSGVFALRKYFEDAGQNNGVHIHEVVFNRGKE